MGSIQFFTENPVFRRFFVKCFILHPRELRNEVKSSLYVPPGARKSC